MNFSYPFYFLRHGETVWNKARKTQGQLDSQLNDTGREQARLAAQILKNEPIERIVSSPLTRVRDTAAAVAEFHDVEIIYDDDLKECHLGDMQGQPHGDWLPAYWEHAFDPPNGETFRQFSNRVWDAMARAVGRGPNTLIVAHGGLWRAAHEFTNIEPPLIPMANAQPIHVMPGTDGWSAKLLEING